MTIREWIRDREISGFPTFSVEEIRLALPHYSEQVIKNDLFRISSQGIIYPVYKGFYVIIPPHYAAKRMVPPIYYIDQLMSYLNKPYYISLLNAAEIHGAAHQRPQKFSVMSVFPKSSVSQSKNNTLVWVYRKEIPTDFLLSKNSETGVIYYSNAELTALDIVQYEQYIGGLSRASTILEELTEKLDDYGLSLKICQCCKYFQPIVDGSTNMIKGCCNCKFPGRVEGDIIPTLVWNTCPRFEEQNIVELF